MNIRNYWYFIFLVVVSASYGQGNAGKQSPVANYHLVWDTPSSDSRGSMPFGNGDIGGNVWVTPAGELLFYISKTDAWSAHHRLLKIGRLKLKFTPALPVGQFRQELDLESGMIRITGKQDGGKRTLALSVWADANHPVIHVEGESSDPVKVEVFYDGWRQHPRVLEGTNGNERESAYGSCYGPFPVVEEADTLLPRANELIWCHHNQHSIWKETLSLQALTEYPDADKDPLLHRTFGALVYGEGLINSAPQVLTTEKNTRRFLVNAVVSTLPSGTVAEWETGIRRLAEPLTPASLAKRKARHKRFWNDVWNRNYILVGSPLDSQEVAGVTNGYLLQRYLNVCAGRGNMPIKFNGTIFNVDSVNEKAPFDADYRRWGGCYWFQNTRLPYWAMLHSGDFEMMKPWFRMYMDALPMARYCTEKYFGHAGAYFPETMYFWGTFCNDNYGWNRAGKPDGLTDNQYIRYYLQGNIEVVAVMLDYYDFTLDDIFLKDTLLPFASEIVTFYRRHYRKGDDGKILFDPASSLETYWNITNPLPEIAGLRFILPRLLQLKGLDAGLAETCRTMLAEMPNIPTGEKDGQKALLPGFNLNVKTNEENPELYAVFPYRHYGLGKPSLDLALHTYDKRIHKASFGWHQNAIQAALLGKTEEAAEMVTKSFNTKNEGSRFPAFWGPNYDWVPDQDPGGVNMRALQNMLIQTENDDILLFPAWPTKWNVKFKVWAPKQTSIEGELENGELRFLKVVPANRKKDIRILNDGIKYTK
ncbi:MAG: DUF5703 domain-containing protein [Tannerella sp.]|nr:DUF5703 domain-containing protein [Tannerella sp.]